MLGNLFGPKKDANAPEQPLAPGAGMAPGEGMAPGSGSGAYPPPSEESVQPIPPPTGGYQQPVTSQPGQPVQSTPQTPGGPAPVLNAPTVPAPVAGGADVGGSKMDPALRQNLSALSHLDTRTTQILQNAHKEAVRTKQQHIEPEQILLGLLYDEGIFQLFDQFSVDVAKISRDLQQKEVSQNATGQPTLSNDSVQIFEQAYRGAKGRGVGFVEPIDILLAIYAVNKKLAEYLKTEGVSKEQLEEKLQKTGEYSAGKKTTMERFGIDLTAEAAAGKLDPVVGRDKEVERLIHILLRRTKNNPIIIGEAGVGKTAIIEGLAQQIVSGQVPPDLAKKRIIQLDVSSLVAGASHRGEFEERLREVIKDAMASQGQIVLFIDEIHTLIGAGGDGGAMDASNIIKPHLARGHLQLIGTTTTAEYRKYFEKDKAFERRFQPIIAEEPDEETAMKMLQVLKPKFEKFHSVVITDEAIEAAVKLSKKYIGERYLPDKAVDLLDEASAEVKLGNARGKQLDSMGMKDNAESDSVDGEEKEKATSESNSAEAGAAGSDEKKEAGDTTGKSTDTTLSDSSKDGKPADSNAPKTPGSTDTLNAQAAGAPTQAVGVTGQPDASGATPNQSIAAVGASPLDPNSPVSPVANGQTPPVDPNQPVNPNDPTAKPVDPNAPATDAKKTEGKLDYGSPQAVDGTDNAGGITSLEESAVPGMTASGEKKEENNGTGAANEVHKKDIEKVVASWTGIPVTKLTEDEGKKLLELEKRIHQRLIDQEQAVGAVSEAVRRGRIGLASGARPIASFMFLGPSGTGKTELAKTLSEILFGRDDAIIRLDMSEYMEKHEVAKLIGAPPGYVGYEEGGQLTEAVRAKPYSIVLLDEVEKAHPDVFNILLQVLEDGRLTDNKGNTISFKNTIIVCTSNIGSQMIVAKLGEKDKGVQRTQEQEDKDYMELSGQVNDELRKFFRPELLNRFDDIVIFKPLRRQDMAGIAKLGIKKTAKLLKEQGYGVQITDKGLMQLAKEGYDPMYGARPLRRLIQSSLENPIALLIIGKTFAPGDTILIDYNADKNEYTFTPSKTKEGSASKSNLAEAKGTVEKKADGTDADDAPPKSTGDEDPNSPAVPGATDSTTTPVDPNNPTTPQSGEGQIPGGMTPLGSDATVPGSSTPGQPNQPQTPGGAGYAMGAPAPANPANALSGVEALLGNAAAAPVEQPFDPLALMSTDSSTPSDPAVGANQLNATPPTPVTSNGAAPATS